MTLLGEEILKVLDNIKISTGENIKNKKQLIEYAGELFARNETTAKEITFALNKRDKPYFHLPVEKASRSHP